MALPGAATKRFEETDHVGFFVRRHRLRLYTLVEIWIRQAAALIELQHLQQRLQAPVVHIWTRHRDIAKTRRPEAALVDGVLRNGEASEIGRKRIEPDARVVEGPV